MIPFLCLLASSGSLSARLADGTTVYLSNVSNDPTKDGWRPDGQPTAAFYGKDNDRPRFGLTQKGDLHLIFVLRIPNPPPDRRTPQMTWKWQPEVAEVDPVLAAKSGFWIPPFNLSKTEWYCERLMRHPQDGKPFDIAVKVADTAWRVVQVARFRHGRRTSGSKVIGEATPAYSSMSAAFKKETFFPIEVPKTFLKYNWRVVGFDVMGKELGAGNTLRLAGHPTLYAFGRPADQIGRIQIEIRPYKTVQFKGIQPNPNRVAKL